MRLALPLAAALLAALTAHVSIDIVGDFVLAHDTYDDPAHGSRWFASIVLALAALAALGVLARAVIAETRGRRGALRAALRAAVPASVATFVPIVGALALPLLAGMAWLDDAFAGIDVDDVADLFGGSIPLGAGITLGFAIVCAAALHGLVRLLSRHHRTIVRAVEAFVRIARGGKSAPALVFSPSRSDRLCVAAKLVRSTGANRAPPFPEPTPTLA